jgi:Uma2 family endonuclease
MIQIASEPARADLGRIDLHIPPGLHLDDDLLFQFCRANPELRIERNPDGDLEIMSPTGAETGTRNANLTADMVIWARRDGRGVVFDSSTGFLLPNGAMRSPDLAWVLRERVAVLRPEQRRQFLPLVPDFLIELASPTEAVEDLRAKVREWCDCGVRLGWLVLPDQRQVWHYAPNREPYCLDCPESIGDDEVLPGLVLSMGRIWEPDL